MERLEQVEVSVVPGSDRNIKITKPSDMDLARLFLAEEAEQKKTLVSEYRTGIGWDVHRLVPGRPLILGGVRIPSEHGPGRALRRRRAGPRHHRRTARRRRARRHRAALPRHRSALDRRRQPPVLRHACDLLVAKRAIAIVNVDSTVILERPKLKDYRAAIREKLAEALGLEAGRVSVKFKTAEKLGPRRGPLRRSPGGGYRAEAVLLHAAFSRAARNSSPAFQVGSFSRFAAVWPSRKPKRAICSMPERSQSSRYSSDGW